MFTPGPILTPEAFVTQLIADLLRIQIAQGGSLSLREDYTKGAALNAEWCGPIAAWYSVAMAVVQVKVKAVTGRVRYYPVGDNAPHVLMLIKKKTLSEAELEALKALGCRIERVPGEPEDQ